MDTCETEGLVKMYFSLGLSQKETLHCLATINSVIISRRTLQRILKKASLYRRKEYSDILEVVLFLVEEIKKSAKLYGYRFMHLNCLRSGFIITQDTVRLLLQIIDPEGVERRKSGRIKRRLYVNRGPNFMWHIDSYDKLKPYGICINGAVDGFSRYVIWLKAFTTSSDPRVIAGYFTSAVKQRGGCPTRIRTDMGTENVRVHQMQEALRYDHQDTYAHKCVITGSSTHNQRIESWWAFLRRHSSQYWIEKFHLLKETDKFSGDFLDKNLIQFVFLKMIQEELDEVSALWNSHRIRACNLQNSTRGRPMMMYMLPHLFSYEDRLCTIPQGCIELFEEECLPAGPYPCDQEVFELCCILMGEKDLDAPMNPEDGFSLYEGLRGEIRASL